MGQTDTYWSTRVPRARASLAASTIARAWTTRSARAARALIPTQPTQFRGDLSALQRIASGLPEPRSPAKLRLIIRRARRFESSPAHGVLRSCMRGTLGCLEERGTLGGSSRSALDPTIALSRGCRSMRCGEKRWPSVGRTDGHEWGALWPRAAAGGPSGGADGLVAAELEQIVRRGH